MHVSLLDHVVLVPVIIRSRGCMYQLLLGHVDVPVITSRIHNFGHYFIIQMTIQWFCKQCNYEFSQSTKYCNSCKSMTRFRCVSSKKTGLYTSIYRYKATCKYCAPISVRRKRKAKETKELSQHETGFFRFSIC